MKDLTIVLITNRDNPKIEWFLDSLTNACSSWLPAVIIVDGQHDSRILSGDIPMLRVTPKPNVWNGPSRLTKEDWWGVSNARNTGICLCKTKWISFEDDRSVLMPGWLGHVKAAMESPVPYVLCGRYEKRVGMTVENGTIKHGGTITGSDDRAKYCEDHYSPRGMTPPFKAPGGWTYGCSTTLPLEWALEVGGYDELCDGSGHEDCIFGMMQENRGRPIRYEPRMITVTDRTPGQIGPTYRREDYGVSPNDYSHKVLNLLKDRKTAMHGFDIRKVREDALNGKPWPKPWGPTHHLWDGKPLGELI